MRASTLTVAALLTIAMLLGPPARAEFPGTDVMLPVVARIQGSGNPPPQFYSTVWLTDLSPTNSASLQLRFYQRDSAANPTASASLTLSPGETRRLDDAVTTLFQLGNVAGSLRVTSTEDVLVSTRNYDLPAGGTEKDTTGQYFGAIPLDFAIGAGETTQLQGVEQTTEGRYNFGAVEITGQGVTIRAILLNPNGSTIGSKDYPLPAYGQMQKNVTDVTGAINGVSNALLQLSVTGGSGKVLAYGTHNTNASQDGTGFEMAFKQTLLSGGGLAAVVHDSTLQGDGTAGAPLGIASGGVGATQLANGAVGTTQLAAGAVGANQLAGGAVTKAKLSPSGGTAGQVLATDGANLTWQADGLTLPYAGTANSVTPPFSITNNGGAAAVAGSGSFVGVAGVTSVGFGVGGSSQSGVGVAGFSGGSNVSLPPPAAGLLGSSTNTAGFGVIGTSDQGVGAFGVHGNIDPSLLANPPAVGVFGASDAGDGVSGTTTGAKTYGVHGESLYEGVFGNNGGAGTNGCLGCLVAGAVGYTANASAAGVVGSNVAGGIGVQGNSTEGGIGVEGNSTSDTGGATGPGVLGVSPHSDGVRGLTSDANGVYGQNQATRNDGCVGCATAGVIGFSPNVSSAGVHGNNNGGKGGTGVLGTGDYGVYGSGGTDGVYGTGTTNGVVGQSSAGYGVYGVSSTGYGVYCVGNGGYTGSWTQLSDARLKKDVAPLADALDRVLALRGVSFAWRRDEFPDRDLNPGPQIGFIAQEVEAVYPELVLTDKDGYKSLDYSKLTPILTEAIKAQQAVIESQRAELAAVGERVARLEAQLASLADRLPDRPPAAR